MKKTLFLAAGLFYSVFSFAQDIPANEVPSIVLNTFKKTFPKALDVEWELKTNLYKAEFEINRKDQEVWINNEGNVIKLKQDILAKDLPKEVTASISSSYKGYRIDDVEKIQKGSITSYKVELKKGLTEQDVYFDASGKVVDGTLN